MLSPIGKALRHLRLETDERLMDMAQRLDVTSSFLSAVEMGRKVPPRDLAEKVIKNYGLSVLAANNIRSAASASQSVFKIEAQHALARDTAGLLADKFSTLSDIELNKIKGILQSRG